MSSELFNMKTVSIIFGVVVVCWGASVPHAIDWPAVQAKVTEYRAVIHASVLEMERIVSEDTENVNCLGNITEVLTRAETLSGVIIDEMDAFIAAQTLTDLTAQEYFERTAQVFLSAETELGIYLPACLSDAALGEVAAAISNVYAALGVVMEAVIALLRE